MSVSDLIKNKLYDKAKTVMEKAYAPYSKFKVGAAIFDENGKYHVGCNIENAAYPIGNCAEASAISAMIASNGNKIIAISVTGYGNLLCTPCGGCRQRIREFASLNERCPMSIAEWRDYWGMHLHFKDQLSVDHLIEGLDKADLVRC